MNNDGWQRARCCVLIRLARIMIFCAGLCFPTRIYVFQCVSLFFASKAGCRAKSTSRTQHSAKPASSRINHPHDMRTNLEVEHSGTISKLFPSWFTESDFFTVFLSGCQKRGRWHWCQGPRRRGFHGARGLVSSNLCRQEMFPGPQEPAPEVPGTGTHVGKVFHGGSCWSWAMLSPFFEFFLVW